MEFLVRGLTVYLFLLLVFRISGKRTLAHLTPFDLVLVLIISETTQQAMIAQDQSMTNAVLLILTLIGIDILLSWLKLRVGWLDRFLDDRPLVIVKDGKPLRLRMNRERVGADDVMAAARKDHGIRTMDEIDIAVLEANGQISIFPRRA